MKFDEAMKIMKRGARARRKDWRDDCYVYVENDSFKLVMAGCVSQVNYGIVYKDMVADDWVLNRSKFNFESAMKRLNDGDTVYRLSNPGYKYIKKDDDILTGMFSARFSAEDVWAKDWTVVQKWEQDSDPASNGTVA
jgi:hypothetical protein